MRAQARREAIDFVHRAIGSFWEFAQNERDRKMAEPAEQWRFHLNMIRLLPPRARVRIAWHRMQARRWEARTFAEFPSTYKACCEEAARR